MKFKYNALAIVLASIGFTSMAHAADGNITFTGKIVATACTVTGTSGSDVAVDLGTVSSSAFPSSGAAAAARTFAINLSGCADTLKSASVSFDGTPDLTNNKLLKITAGDSAASGVGIGIYESDSATLIPLLTSSKDVTITSGAATLNFVAKYVSTQAAVTAGDANATATFTISYK